MLAALAEAPFMAPSALEEPTKLTTPLRSGMQIFLRALLADRVHRTRMPALKSKVPGERAEARARRELARQVTMYLRDHLAIELEVVRPGIDLSNLSHGKLCGQVEKEDKRGGGKSAVASAGLTGCVEFKPDASPRDAAPLRGHSRKLEYVTGEAKRAGERGCLLTRARCRMYLCMAGAAHRARPSAGALVSVYWAKALVVTSRDATERVSLPMRDPGPLTDTRALSCAVTGLIGLEWLKAKLIVRECRPVDRVEVVGGEVRTVTWLRLEAMSLEAASPSNSVIELRVSSAALVTYVRTAIPAQPSPRSRLTDGLCLGAKTAGSNPRRRGPHASYSRVGSAQQGTLNR